MQAGAGLKHTGVIAAAGGRVQRSSKHRGSTNLKRITQLFAAATLAAAAASATATDVGVSVQIGQPGFYGRIDIGNSYPQPQLVYPQPVIIRPVVGVPARPVYLHVPPGHAKNWRKHCGKYNACGQRVYFVQDGWYNDVYVPQYQQKHGKGNGKGHGHGKGHKHDD
jgi:hypothetical protein